MTRFTKQRQAKIVKAFQRGHSMNMIAWAWEVPIAKIESVIRKAIQQLAASQARQKAKAAQP